MSKPILFILFFGCCRCMSAQTPREDSLYLANKKIAVLYDTARLKYGFYPNMADLLTADSLITSCIYEHNRTDTTNRTINLDKFYRQYLSYIENNEKVIFVICFQEHKHALEMWKRDIATITYVCHFLVTLNLTTKQYFDLKLNWVNCR